MADPSGSTTTPGPPVGLKVIQEVFSGKVLSSAIGAACDLSIADTLHKKGPLTITELAEETKTHAESLYRLLRLLVAHGYFKLENDRYSLNELTEVWLESHPQSCKGLLRWITSEPGWRPYAKLAHSVKTGEATFDHIYGMPIWEWFKTHDKETNDIFNLAMTDISRPEGVLAVKLHDYSHYETIADVGGGHGHLVSQILLANPNIKKGIVFDQQHVVESASATNPLMENSEVKGRLHFEAGSFFEGAPKEADAYILKHIIHDWGDEACINILTHIRKNMKKSSKLIIFDAVVPENNSPHFGKTLDMEMLVILGKAKERTAKEFEVLLKKSGFKMTKVIANEVGISVVEGEALDS